MLRIGLQLAPLPPRPHLGVRGERMDCTKSLFRGAYLPLRQALFPASDGFPKDCSSCWLPRVATSGARPINCTTQITHIERQLHDIYGFEREDCKFENTSKITPLAVAFFFSYIVWFILYVVHSVLLTLEDRVGKGIHNLVIVSGDKTLLSIASIGSLASRIAIPFALSTVVGVALGLGFLSLGTGALRKYRLNKQAQAKTESDT